MQTSYLQCRIDRISSRMQFMNSVWMQCANITCRLETVLYIYNSFRLVIGGWGNTRILIRRKYSGNVLSETFEDDMMTEDRPTKFLIEIAKSK